MISFEELQQICPQARPDRLNAIVEPINDAMKEYEINDIQHECLKALGVVSFGQGCGQIGEILKIKTKQGTATLIIDGRRVKAQLKTLRPEPKEEVAA